MDKLTRRVVDYQKSGTGFQALFDDISTIAYRFPRHNGRCTEDDCGDFLLFFRSRIGNLLNRYQYHGVSFEAYLHTNLKWQLRTYLRYRERTTLRAHLAQRPTMWQDSPPSYGLSVHQAAPTFNSLPSINSGNKGQRRRLMIIALKACLHLTESDVVSIAEIVNCDPDWLRDCWLRLRVRLSCRRLRHDGLRLRRNRLFVLVHSLHYQVMASTDETERQRLIGELSGLRRRLSTVRGEIAKIPQCPTNLEIAEVTAIPKGTIDSTLFYAKRRLEIPVKSDRPKRGASR